MEWIRTFIAVNLPPTVIDKVASVQAKVFEQAKQLNLKVGWVPLANMHITLHFLGNIQPANVGAIKGLMDLLAGQSDKISLEVVRQIGAFPDLTKPEILWMGINDTQGRLVGLAQDVGKRLTELGFEVPKKSADKPFVPHITIGRVKENPENRALSPLAESVAPISCVAAELVLYQSELQKKHAEYRALYRVNL